MLAPKIIGSVMLKTMVMTWSPGKIIRIFEEPHLRPQIVKVPSGQLDMLRDKTIASCGSHVEIM